MKNSNRDGSTNCCEKRSVLEKILIVVIVLLLCLLIVLFAVFIVHLQNGKRDDSLLPFEAVPSASMKRHEAVPAAASSGVQQNRTSTCTTRECVRAAAQILDFIDPSVDPCVDFYRFVCGNYLNKSTEVNEITPLSKLNDATLSRLDSLITDPVSGSIPKSLELQRKYFKTCMNTQAIEYDNSYTLLNLIKKLGDWPVLLGRYWNGNKFNWVTSMVESRNIGFGYEFFLSLSVVDVSNGTGDFLLSIDPPVVLDIPYQLREFYIDVMANISIDLGAPSYLAKEQFVRVLEFEEHLRTLAEDESRNGRDAVVKVSDLQATVPSVQWKYFLNEITKAPKPFRDDTKIHLGALRFLPNLINLLANIPVSTQANYVVWKIVENFLNYLKESVRTRYESFLMAVDPNYSAANNRYVYCLNNAKFYFPAVAELAYVRRFLPSHKRADIERLAAEIKTQLVDVIKRSDWLDELSKSSAADKVAASKEHIGSSDQAYNDDFDQVVDMKNFDLYTDNVVEMTTALYARRTDGKFAILDKQSRDYARETLDKHPVLSVNAFFTHVFNTLVVPAPFLQGIIYNFHRPQYMNYGALGSVIGHEFTHSFISQREVDKWTAEAKQKYKERIQCLLDDYKQYNAHLAEFTKDERAVLEENIADLVGPEVSYRAYRELTRTRGREPGLPSLDYTPNQIFWIMSGIFKCYQPKQNPQLRFDEKHGVPSFAVVASVKNSPSFAADFNCPSGSNMNPRYKCRIL